MRLITVTIKVNVLQSRSQTFRRKRAIENIVLVYSTKFDVLVYNFKYTCNKMQFFIKNY